MTIEEFEKIYSQMAGINSRLDKIKYDLSQNPTPEIREKLKRQDEILCKVYNHLQSILLGDNTDNYDILYEYQKQDYENRLDAIFQVINSNSSLSTKRESKEKYIALYEEYKAFVNNHENIHGNHNKR